MIRTLQGKTPIIGKNCFIAQNSIIIGDVVIGDECSIWFNVVIRGDVHSIRIGSRTNIQDGAILHCTYQKYSLTIGNNVSIGHGAIVHGCVIEDNVLIGMGAKVLDGAVVRKNSIIAAGAVVLSNTEVPEGSLYAGNPATFKKRLDEHSIALIHQTADNYVKYKEWYAGETW
ncbi:MAG: gamma carbonic anhydrase family protein [Bacteroidia bacterium]|nr:gamma carbonic anhydrase family protein [Bacteroidia bacterium]MDW8302147.1 gamma carbonic anhydrase family protein [Bacteroidia bacterium]